MYKSLLIKISFTTAFCFFMLGCERSAPSPVEIKIDNYVSGTHTVFNNETLYDIAYRYNIDPINLAKINKLNPPYQLKNGQVLQLPTSDMNLSKKSQTNEADTENIEMKNVGYVAIDDDSNEENTSNQKSKDEIDEDFDSIVLDEQKENKKTKSGTITSNKDKIEDKKNTSDKNVKTLSTPKVTSTAVGEPIANKEKKEKLQATTGNIKNKSLSNSNKMRMPVNGKIISHFGDISDGIANDGINIKANKGTDVIAAADGTVIYVGSKLDEEYGNVVIVQHDNGLITSYAHLDKALVKKDKKILAGEKLGTVGQTGDVQEPQLYFEVMKDKKPVNPLKYLKK